MDKRDAIVEAAASLLCTSGLSSFTVTRVARAARGSSALVHYHFATKQRLLVAAAERLAARRTAARIAGLGAGRGLVALDALWDRLVEGAAHGAERAWPDLLLLARGDAAVAALLARERDGERRAVAAALPPLLADLESRPRIAADDLAAATVTFLDGVALALAAGTEAAEVRASYDAFWLALAALGQGQFRR
jgi:AcrR family transcriptional regulator